MEDNTATTPTNFIHAIVKQNNSEVLKLISLPCQLDHHPSDEELRKFHHYATSLGCAYSSCIDSLDSNESMLDRDIRLEAVAWKDTYNKLQREYTTVAFSHRYGGWTCLKWKFNEDICFHISTNFGYGCSSYFYLIVKYKDTTLTPYEDYIRYRFADASQLVRYTETYGVEESSWRRVMEDALAFYNAVVFKKDLYIFNWITRHLESMTSGIEKLRTAMSISFDNYRGGTDEAVTGDELTIVKANKIANSLDFIDNIRTLPSQVNPERYVDRLLCVCRTYLPEQDRVILDLSAKASRLKDEIDVLEQNQDYQLYYKIRDKYYYKRDWQKTSSKIKMLRFLLSLLHHTMPSMQLDEVRERIAELKKLLDEVKKKEYFVYDLNRTISNLETCREKITMFLEKDIQASA